MKLLATLLLLIPILGCNKTITVAPQEAPKVFKYDIDTSKVMHLFGNGGVAHACPVEGQVLSAKHVVLKSTPMGKAVPLAFAWSNDEDFGEMSLYQSSTALDLAKMQLMTGRTSYYKRSSKLPVAGDEVYWVEYELENRGRAFMPKVRKAKVMHTIANHVVFDQLPVKGASGGCIFNAENKVVGILIWGVPVTFSNGVGVGVLITRGI